MSEPGGPAGRPLPPPRTDPATFEARYREDPDPWGFAEAAYERGKFDRTVAALAPRRFGHALELGCANGDLTALLAERCDRLVAIDAAPTAVARARERLAGTPGVEVLLGTVPEDLPVGPWDLIVASEILYYLGPGLLAQTMRELVDGLAPGGQLLSVHWTGSAASHAATAAEVVAALVVDGRLGTVLTERHTGYRLDLLERTDRA